MLIIGKLHHQSQKNRLFSPNFITKPSGFSQGHHKGQVVRFKLFGVLEAPLARLQDDGSHEPRDATGQVDDASKQ